MRKLARWFSPILIAYLFLERFAAPGRLRALAILIVMVGVWFACVQLLRGSPSAQTFFTGAYVLGEFVCFGLLGPQAQLYGNPEPLDYFAITAFQGLFIYWLREQPKPGGGSDMKTAAAAEGVSKAG